MKKIELIKELENFKKNILSGKSRPVLSAQLSVLITKIKLEPIRDKNYKKSFKKIHIKSQKGRILNYLKKNSDKSFLGSDFMKNNYFNNVPYIGYSATARLSELKRQGLVEIVGTKKGIMVFLRKSNDRNLYKITEKGLNFKIYGNEKITK